RNGEDEGKREQEGSDHSIKERRPFNAIQDENRLQDSPAVTIGRELGFRSLGPGRIGRLDLPDRHPKLEGMDADLSLDLEPGRENREAFDEPARKNAI